MYSISIQYAIIIIIEYIIYHFDTMKTDITEVFPSITSLTTDSVFVTVTVTVVFMEYIGLTFFSRSVTIQFAVVLVIITLFLVV